MNEFVVLDGEYQCLIECRAEDVLVAHINHVRRTPDGVRWSVEVAQMSAHIDVGTEGIFQHWCVRLFLDSDVRYNARDSSTEIVANPELQAGDNQELLEHLISLRDSDMPYSHPDLPRAIVGALLEHGFCSEPLALHIHHSISIDIVTFGEVYDG